MDVRLIELSQLNDKDLKQLAVLHRSVMHTLLSDLGLPVVMRYYQIAKTDPNVLGLCGRADSGDLVGWAMGSPHPDRINAGLRSPLTWFLGQMFRVMLTRPLVFWQLISSVISASGQVDLKHGAIELTYIGVAADQQGKGIGKKVLNAFVERCSSRGYTSVVLSVEKENIPAISLYETTGFRITKTFSEGRYQRHRMELTL